MAWRKARPVEEFVNDKAFGYQLGVMVGAMQMAGHVLTLHEDEKVHEIGKRLYEASSWFFEGTSSVYGTEEQTAILPPRAASGS
jgi:hypothetical protein